MLSAVALQAIEQAVGPQAWDRIAQQLLHYTATAARWDAIPVPIPGSSKAQLFSAADPLRIGVWITTPSSLASIVYIGPDKSVTGTDSAGGYQGWPLPVGGGLIFGPENTKDIYVVCATAFKASRIQLFRAA